MAVFSLGSGTETNSLDSMEKVKSYLYRLTEQLKYNFSNLDPEENFDERSKLIYAATQQKQAELEVTVDGIKASLNDYEKGVEALIQVTVEGITQQYVTRDGVAAAINLNDQGVKIQGTKIAFEGIVTANNNFKILSDGSMEAVNGKFSGSITTQGTGTNPKFLYMSDGSLTGGRGVLTNQSGIIAFDEYVVLNDNPVPAMRIASDALLLGGQVFTTTQARQGGTMDVYMGQTKSFYNIITNIDIVGGDLYWDAISMSFVNGILVGSQSIHHWDEDEYDPGPS